MGASARHLLRLTAIPFIVFFTIFAPAQDSAPAQQEQKPAQEQPSQSNPDVLNPQPPVKTEFTEDELRDLVRRAMENDQANYRQQKDLTHVERQQIEHLDGRGNIKKTETVTKEILILYGDRMERVIERNDQTLSAEEKKKEDAKFDKEVAKLQKESPEDRQKRIDKYEEQSRKAREFVAEVSKAFNFKFDGEESLNGRPAYVVSGEPRSDYKPTTREGKILSKTRGKMWIDVASTHWVKLDAEFTDTMSFGWFLARVRPGTRVVVEQKLFRDDVWVPEKINFNLDARVGLFKQLFQNIDVTFRDWRKFSSEARILDYSEIEQKPAPAPTPTVPQQ